MDLLKVLIFVFLPFTFFTQHKNCFVVDDIKVIGNSVTSEDAIITLSGLKIGDCVQNPSPKVKRAINRLWDEGVFDVVKMDKLIENDKNILVIHVTEYHLLGKISFLGVNGSEEKKINEFIQSRKKTRYAPATLKEIETGIKKLLKNKGYRNPQINCKATTDSLTRVGLLYTVDKGERTKISQINIKGSEKELEKTIVKSLGEIQKKIPFKSGKFYTQDLTQLKNDIIHSYKEQGFLDITIDSIVDYYHKGDVEFTVYVEEGSNYLLKEVVFDGNQIFSSKELKQVVAPLLGKSYSKSLLESKLFFEEKRHDITSLYLDNGYANLNLKYKTVVGIDSSIQVIVSINENDLYEYGKIDFKGNVRTKDKVLHQTVLTSSGDLFSRSKIILSQTKLQQLDYFIPEEFDVELNIDTVLKRVDVTYIVKERISDRFLVSGGFDGTYLVGTLGFDFKNFELSDVFRKGARWNPLPAGGGQHLSLKAQSDAQNYYGISFLFEEPRLKNKPIGVGFSSDYAFYNDDSAGTLKLFSSQIGVSHFPNKRNPFWRLTHQINFQNYRLDNYSLFGFENGGYNAINYKASLVNQTTNNSYFPTKGKLLKLEGSSTVPYSLFKTVNQTNSIQENYKWLEYYKVKASFKHYFSLNKKQSTVLASKFGAGVLGRFSNELNVVPFERFEMGGTGITNYSINANDIIGLRGYEVGSLSNDGGDPLALKMSIELRQKVVSFEKWMLTSHLFYENGNTFAWGDNITLNHATGIGARLFIPMLGVVGIDCGWGLNKQNFKWKEPTVQFTIGLDVGDF